MLVATVTPLQSKNELTQWDNRPFCGVWHDPQQYTKPTGVTKPLKKKSRRVRTAYTTEQLRALEKRFTQSRYINPETRKELARSLKLGEKCIKIWFQNRRMKEKRESSESESNSDVSSESFAVESVKLPSPVVYNNEKQVSSQKNILPIVWFQNKRIKEKQESSESEANSDVSSTNLPVENVQVPSPVVCDDEKQVFPQEDILSMLCKQDNQENETSFLNDQRIPQNSEYQPYTYSNFLHTAIPEQSNCIHNQMYYYNNMYQTEYYPNCGREYYANNVNYFQNANYGNVGNSDEYWCANNFYYS